jgi:hypothetical protein
MGGGTFQLVMVYLSAAHRATAPENIVFKLSRDCEIVQFLTTNPTLTPKYDCPAT